MKGHPRRLKLSIYCTITLCVYTELAVIAPLFVDNVGLHNLRSFYSDPILFHSHWW